MLKMMHFVNKKLIYFFIICLFCLYGVISYQRGEAYSNPYRLYSDAILKAPENIRTIYNMGVAYFSNQEYEKAIVEFNKVSKINPIYMRDKIWLLTAMSYRALRNKGLARKYYYKAMLLNPLDRDIVDKFISSFISFDEAKKYLLDNTVRLNDNIYFGLKKYKDIN